MRAKAVSHFLSVCGLLDRLTRERKRQLLGLLVLAAFVGLSELVLLFVAAPVLHNLTSRSQVSSESEEGPAALISSMAIKFSLGELMLGFVLILTITNILKIILIYQQSKISEQISTDIGIQVFQSALGRQYCQHSQQHTSVLLSAAQKARSISNVTVIPILNIASTLLSSLAIIAGLAYLNTFNIWWLLVPLATAYAAIWRLARSIICRNGKLIASKQRDATRILQDTLGGMAEVILGSHQKYFLSRYKATLTLLSKAAAENKFFSLSPRYLIEIAVIFSIAGFIYTTTGPGFSQTGETAQILTTLGVLFLGFQRLLPQMQQFYTAYVGMASAKFSLDDVLREISPVDMSRRLKPTDTTLNFNNSIKFSNVTYVHSAERKAGVYNVDFEIFKGDRIGIVGRSGVGKTTLINLLSGLLMPSSGEIYIDGLLLDQKLIQLWRQRVSVVHQSIFLVDGTVAENVAFGEDYSSHKRARLIGACESAGLGGLIESWPEGLSTRIGEGGCMLSGGQRQRIGIARAIYKNADLIILDEASSALDTNTESAIRDMLTNLDRSTTLVIIGHRGSLIDICDRVMHIEKTDGSNPISWTDGYGKVSRHS